LTKIDKIPSIVFAAQNDYVASVRLERLAALRAVREMLVAAER
jgi:hypothetical protein